MPVGLIQNNVFIKAVISQPVQFLKDIKLWIFIRTALVGNIV